MVLLPLITFLSESFPSATHAQSDPQTLMLACSPTSAGSGDSPVKYESHLVNVSINSTHQ